MKKKKWLKGIGIAVLVIAAVCIVIALANYCCNVGLRKYIESFEPVAYDTDRLVPEKEAGHYTFTTDGEFKVMHLTDMHIGGGFWTYKRDKKAIYEVITMLRAEKPDLVILGGDNTYAIIPLGFNGGGTFNNKMVAKTVIDIFEHEEVYFTTVFGNHDTEAMDFYDRYEIAALYESEDYKYCIFQSEFDDADAETRPSVTNQCILLKNESGNIRKVLMLIDSNDYIDGKFFTSVFGKYDTIHEKQIDWAAQTIKALSKQEGLEDGKYLSSIFFYHIPTDEFQMAYDDLITDIKDEKGNLIGFESNKNPKDTTFIQGWWDEKYVYYGGRYREDIAMGDHDKLFEVLSEEMNSMEACFVGHDHVNNALIDYKGVRLCFGMSVDNIAYGNKISNCGMQRGANILTLNTDDTFTIAQKNAYKDYGCEMNKFVPVQLETAVYPERFRTYEY